MKIIFLLLSSFVCAEMVEEAVQRPVAFAVVREDPSQDIEVIRRYFPEEKVSMMMVASGGCTAAAVIADVSLKNLTLVDPNLSQLQLSKLKIQLLTLVPKKRLEILGYLPMDSEDRKSILLGFMHALDIDQKTFGDLSLVSENGPDFIGRYERIFEEIRTHLAPYKGELMQLFGETEIGRQAEQISPEAPLGKAIDEAFDAVMSQDNLTRIFGERATANRVQDFSRHFVERARSYLASHLASGSPWMAHLFLGHFYGETIFPWLSLPVVHCFPAVDYFHGTMDAALEQAEAESYQVVHLSNILDWLSEAEAKKTLQLAFSALKPGGCVIIRQLNSNLDIPSLGTEYEWKSGGEDRSFFYRNFYLGFKPRLLLAPKVQNLADAVLKEIPIMDGTFFEALPTMPEETFRITQQQFYFAVDYFSRPMTALVARLPLHKDRIDIIHNIVEEHGDFSIERYHSNTFRQFLGTLGVAPPAQPSANVNAFNYTLMGVCANEDPITAIACNGIIEYAFADISALLGKTVIDRKWVQQRDLVHYDLHANIDKRHAEELFQIIEPYAQDPRVIAGLRLGAYIFNRLYEDLYADASSNGLPTQ